MKIAMIGHKRAPSRDGGVEVVVTELSRRMAALGNDVTVYNRSTGHEKNTTADGVHIVEVKTPKNSKLNALVYSYRAAFKALRGGYDVIHFHAEGPCAAINLVKLFGKRAVATIHGLDWKQAKWGGFAKKYLMFGERTAAKKADELIVLSPTMNAYFKETYGRDCVCVPNGITPLEPIPPKLITERFGLEKNKYILFLARITPVKRLDLLLKAFAAVDTDMKLAIAGSADRSTPYMEEILDLAEKDKRVILTGFVDGALLNELYANCYLYVLPSDSEGMPLSLLEAISAGARCLISDIPESTGVAGEYAHTFRRGDEASLKEKLTELTAHPEQRAVNFRAGTTEAEVEAQIKAIIKSHSWDDVVEETLKLYKS